MQVVDKKVIDLLRNTDMRLVQTDVGCRLESYWFVKKNRYEVNVDRWRLWIKKFQICYERQI